jgi:peptidoglycan/xylan/chitin deacetylase (PgdA/CDA1 family)
MWCDTWKTQLPRLDEATRITEGLPVDFVTVAVDGRWMDRIKGSKLLADAGGAWSGSIGIDHVPYTLVVDSEGTVRWSSFGIVRSADVASQVRLALKPMVGGGAIYLTFDDFPAPQNSEDLLDALRAVDVPATFFVVCDRADQFRAVLKRAVGEGHSVQIHSWSHDARNPQLDKCRQAVRLDTGQEPTLYRPPGSEQIFRLGGRPLTIPVVDPYDFDRPSEKELLRRILSQVKPGCEVQLHAGVEQTVRILPQLVESLKRLGFHFEVLG